MGKIGQCKSCVADLSVELVNFFMGQAKKLVEQTEARA